jgi:membrane protein
VPGDVFWGVARDDCLGLSAQIAYYGLLSLFPFLLFLRSLVPHLPGKGQVVESALAGLEALVTQDSRLYEIVRDNIVDQLNAGSPTILSVGIILTLWSASSAFSVLIKAVNRAYGVGETRSWQHRRLVAVGLTLLTAVLLPAGVTLVLLGPTLGGVITRLTGAGSAVHVVWLVLRWPGVFLLLVVPMTIIYYVAPNTRQQVRWVLPGSLFAVAATIGLSLAFSWFIGLNLFELKWFTYGAIGTVIVILFWMYLTGLAILIGAEVNDAMGRAMGRPLRNTTRTSTPG